MTSLETDRVHMMDCIEGMSLLEAGLVDVVVTSPPYNIGKEYHEYDDSRPLEEYLSWMGEVGAAVRRVLADSGSFFLNVGGRPSDPWRPLDVAHRMREHFELQNVVHWVKSIAISKEDVGRYPAVAGDIAVGHYKPVNSARYLNGCHEYIFHLTKTGDVPLDKLAVGVPYQDKSNIGRWDAAQEDKRDRGNTWFIPYSTIWSSRPHPTVFPERLPEMCVRLHGVERTRLVLDPFMGTGTTAVACARLGVPFIGFEIDPEYVTVAEERLRELAFGDY